MSWQRVADSPPAEPFSNKAGLDSKICVLLSPNDAGIALVQLVNTSRAKSLAAAYLDGELTSIAPEGFTAPLNTGNWCFPGVSGVGGENCRSLGYARDDKGKGGASICI